MCGCDGFFSNICNVSIGPTQGIVLHGVDCAYPGLVTLPDGNLLTALACPGQTIDTELSTDKGVTWKPNSTISINGTADALALLPNGELFLSTSQWDASGNGLPTYLIGTLGAGDLVSWSAPVAVRIPGWTMGCYAVSPVVQLANGNLLWPVYCNNNATGNSPCSSLILLSMDGGVTWPKLVIVGNGVTDARDYDESAAVVYPNGDILMVMRNTSPGDTDRDGTYWRSKSTDNGETWSAPAKMVNSGDVGRPTLALLPSGGLVLLGRVELDGYSVTGFGTSWNEGQTFSGFSNLGVGGAGTDNYDAMSSLPDGSVAVVTVHSINGTTNNIDYRNLVDRCPSSSATKTMRGTRISGIIPVDGYRCGELLLNAIH